MIKGSTINMRRIIGLKHRIIVSIIFIAVSVSAFFGCSFLRESWRLKKETMILVSCLKKRSMYRKDIDYTHKVEVANRFSDMFGLDPRLVYAVGIRESGFVSNAVHTNRDNRSGRNIDVGDYQINLRCWEYDLGDGRHLGKVYGRQTNRVRKIIDYLVNSDFNTYAACYILSIKLSEGGNLVDGVMRYNGTGESSRRYARDVLDIYCELNLIAREMGR